MEDSLWGLGAMRPAGFPNIPLFASSDQDGEFDLDESMDVARHVEELLRRPIDSLDARLSPPAGLFTSARGSLS